MNYLISKKVNALKLTLVIALFAYNGSAQSGDVDAPASGGFGDIVVYLLLVLGVAALIGAYFARRKRVANEVLGSYNYKNPESGTYGSRDSYDMRSVEADKEMEWLRQAKMKRPSTKKQVTQPLVATKSNPAVADRRPIETRPISLDARSFQENLRKLQYSQLPINSFGQLAAVKKYQELPVSDDASLLTAIEQANDEFEEDEAIREVALRVLSAFKTKNSVEALSQIALYDLSANLRSKAVSVLTEFDHESVFETILLACADPTREVRATAARGLFRLNFDRAHSWKRIIETNDDFRMKQAARAATEAGIVTKSFDRLVHEDLKVAYEAFALVSLLIKAGETKGIFESIREHRDLRVKYALLHVLKVHRDDSTVKKLNEMLTFTTLNDDLKNRIRETLKTLEKVSV